MSEWLQSLAKDIIKELVIAAAKAGARKVRVYLNSTGTPPSAGADDLPLDFALSRLDAFLRAIVRQELGAAQEHCYFDTESRVASESVLRLFAVEPPLGWVFSLIHYSVESISGDGPHCVGIEGEMTFPLGADLSESVPALVWMVQADSKPWSVYEIEWFFGEKAGTSVDLHVPGPG